MLDLKFVRENAEAVRAGARRKGFDVDALVERTLALDRERRSLLSRVEEIRAGQKRAGKEIAATKDAAAREAILEREREAKREREGWEARLAEVEGALRDALLRLPNLPGEDVPDGSTAADNVEIRRVGEPPAFDFPARDHVEIGEALGAIDIPRGARLAGARNYALVGAGARLEAAVLRFAFDHMVRKHFVPVSVPVLVRDEAMVGTGYYPGGEDQAYRIEKDGLSLVGTAEVPVTALHAGEILDEVDLPRRFVALSTCFRREAGAAGREVRGLYRVHQFQKVEQVVLTIADPEASRAEHESIVRNAEEVLEALELPYRVVHMCAGDLGAGQVEKFDIETWMPSRKAYGETHSASRFHDWQARRLDLRYRGGDGGVRFVHTLNNTVIASPRVLIALLENHQRADGSVRVPPALRPYLDGWEAIRPPAVARGKRAEGA